MAGPDGTTAAPDAHPVVSAQDASLEQLVEAGLLAERRPIAAVPIRTSLGDRVQDALVVVCDDGACFKRGMIGAEWVELEPVPGTPRSFLWEQAGD